MAEKTVIMDAQAISRAITRISFEIVERNRGAEDLCLDRHPQRRRRTGPSDR